MNKKKFSTVTCTIKITLIQSSEIFLTGIQDTSIVERGRNIVSCSRDGTAKLWDCGTKQCLGTFSECGGSVNSCAIGAVSGAVELGQPDSTPSKIVVDQMGLQCSV